MLILLSMTFTLMQGHSGSAEGTKNSVELSGQVNKYHRLYIRIKLATTVGHSILQELDFQNIYMA